MFGIVGMDFLEPAIGDNLAAAETEHLPQTVRNPQQVGDGIPVIDTFRQRLQHQRMARFLGSPLRDVGIVHERAAVFGEPAVDL